MKKNLVDRHSLGEVPRAGVWFRYGCYSILNVGELMKAAAYPASFTGWEALDENHEVIRANTWQELELLLTNP